MTLSEHGDDDLLLDVGDVGGPASRDLVGWVYDVLRGADRDLVVASASGETAVTVDE